MIISDRPFFFSIKFESGTGLSAPFTQRKTGQATVQKK